MLVTTLIMGYADMLLMKEIAYGSQEALDILEEILAFTFEHVKTEVNACDSVWERNAKIIEFSGKKAYHQATLSYINTHSLPYPH